MYLGKLSLALMLIGAGLLPLAAQSPSLVCQANSGVPPIVRASGLTERVGDVVINCIGGSGTVNTSLSLTLNTTVTSRSFNPGYEAILLIDEPAAPIPGVNLFQASSISGNTVVFSGISFAAPGTDKVRTLRISNIRVDASAIGATTSGLPNQILASVSAAPQGSLPIDNPNQTVAFVQNDLLVDTVLPSSGLPTGYCGGHNQPLVNSTSTTGVVDFAVRFREAFTTVFKPKTAAASQNVPGNSYNSESGYFDPTLPATNGLNKLGLAETGTRLTLRFANIPTGVRVYVTTDKVNADTANSVRLVTSNGTTVPPTGAATWEGQTYGIAQVDPNSLTAEWEVTNTNPYGLDTVQFGVLLAWSAGSLPSLTQHPAVIGYLGPLSPTGVPRFMDPVLTASAPVLPSPVGPCVSGTDLLAFSASSLPTRGGTTANTKVTLMNRGDTASGPFTYRLELIDPTTQKAGSSLEATVPGLAAGEARTLTARFRPSLSDSGARTARLTVDPNSAVTDVNRTNNVWTSPGTFTLACGTATSGNIAAPAAGGSYPMPLWTGCVAETPSSYVADGTFVNWIGSSTTPGQLQIAANPLGRQRTAYAYSSSYGYFGIQQASADPNCPYTVTGDYSTAPVPGATRTYTVQTNPGCQWSAVSNTRWAAPSGEVFTGPGSFTLKIRPNFSSVARYIPVVAGNSVSSIMQPGNSRPRDERLVQMIYYYFLGRLPSEAEIAFQAAAARGADVEDFMPRFLTALEFDIRSRYIAGLYVGLLARDAEFNGFLYQRDALLTGIVTQDQLVSNFLNALEWQLRFGSPDNAGFVRLMYNNVLLRQPTQAEVDWQAGNLAAGLSRVQLASNFLNSQEFRIGTGARLTAFLLYAAVLGRDTAPPEFEAAVARLKAGASPTDVMADLIGSAEFAGILD